MICGGCETSTWNVAEPESPSVVFVTVTLTVSFPAWAYVWLCVPSEPDLVAWKMVCGVLSPQFTSTFHGPVIRSLNEPSDNDWAIPGTAFWLLGGVTVGGW